MTINVWPGSSSGTPVSLSESAPLGAPSGCCAVVLTYLGPFQRPRALRCSLRWSRPRSAPWPSYRQTQTPPRSAHWGGLRQGGWIRSLGLSATPPQVAYVATYVAAAYSQRRLELTSMSWIRLHRAKFEEEVTNMSRA